MAQDDPMASRLRVATALALGVTTFAALWWIVPAVLALLLGWDVAAATYIVWSIVLGRLLDAAMTEQIAVREDPGRATMDAILLGAAAASVGAVVAVIAIAGPGSGVSQRVAIVVAVGSLALSWALVHVLYTGRYARLYYTPPVGGVDFNTDEPPSYSDFAYLAFTIGMTYQVSDTALRNPLIRRTALWHALLSYVLGAGIIASTINLLAGLAR
jgi:uncharacterized membrane protein